MKPELEIGQKVFQFDPLVKEWNEGEIVQKCVEPNSYIWLNQKTTKYTEEHITISRFARSQIKSEKSLVELFRVQIQRLCVSWIMQ